MTVHMIRLHAEDPDEYSDSEIQSAVEDWVASYEEVLTTDRLDLFKTDPGDSDAPVHWAGSWRFSWVEDEVTILDDLESDLQPYVAWYRVGYHVCDHDEDDRTGCSWDEQREDGSVPSGVPTYQ